MHSIPIWRRLLYSFLIFALFMVGLEGSLAALGLWAGRSSETINTDGFHIVCIGDSVTAGFGVGPEAAWPTLLQHHLQGANVTVVNRGRMGQQMRNLNTTHVTKPISDDPALYLIMLGSNDFLRWPANKPNPFLSGAELQEGLDEQTVWEPRLLRVMRWMRHIASATPPTPTLQPELLAMYREKLTRLKQRADTQGSTVALMSYVLPGTPPDSLNENQKITLQNSLEAHQMGNAIVRQVAEELNLPLVDLEHKIHSPVRWDNDWFIDHIHPTAPVQQQIADTTAQWLRSTKRIP